MYSQIPTSSKRLCPGLTKFASIRCLSAMLLMALLAGCANERLLMPAPKLYALTATPTYSRLHSSRQGPSADILYVTDRAPVTDEESRLDYGNGRSRSVGYGLATVSFDGVNQWSDLVQDAGRLTRERDLTLSIRSVSELARTPESPYPFRMIDGKPVNDADVQAQLDSADGALLKELRNKLSRTSHKEVFVYVHGVQNTFAEAVYTTAELWHFMGREGVPLAYTWPAGGGGLLLGYTYDRESSEFTVFHLKSLLKTLAAVPEIEAINLVSHSRGTDVVTSALRELLFEVWATESDPIQTLKIKNLVLAAPDLDIDVMMQRTSTARLSAGIKRMTIYTSPEDKALGLSEFLFGGLRRLGQTSVATAPRTSEETLKRLSNVAMVQYVGTRTGDFGHNYFRKNPAVASDLILAVRYDRDPGAKNGRPLRHKGTIFWELDDSYLEEQRSAGQKQ